MKSSVNYQEVETLGTVLICNIKTRSKLLDILVWDVTLTIKQALLHRTFKSV